MTQTKKTVQLAVRLPVELMKQVDETVRRLQRTSNGVKVTRSDAVRFLVTKGLQK